MNDALREDPSVILIAGPTASGKSAFALALAEALGGVVINADSMQVYRELAILSARPGSAEMARAPHRLYGHVPASEAYSVGRWLGAATAAIADARGQGRVAIVAGGTGLYFAALESGLAEVPDIPAETRRRLRARLAEQGPAALHGELAVRDPAAAAALAPGDSQRIVRALEVLEATGRPLADWQRAASAASPLPARGVRRFVLMPDREALYRRIEERVEKMLACGALEEADALRRQRLDPELPVMRALGVRPLIAHLEDRIGLEAAIDRLKTETRRYAKRQITWARGHMNEWTWIEGGDGLDPYAAARAILSCGRG